MKTLILGFDSFDPKIFEELAGQNQLPNFEKFIEQGGYSQLEVCSPPQTEVSWTSIATGADPGGHGIFDFVHRDPATYIPFVSILAALYCENIFRGSSGDGLSRDRIMVAGNVPGAS